MCYTYLCPPDPTLTVNDVTKVMDKIGDKWKVMRWLGMPESLWEEIERRYSTDSEESRACADYYVHVHPGAAWHHLTRTLHMMEEHTAARESKSFMSTGKYPTTSHTRTTAMFITCSLPMTYFKATACAIYSIYCQRLVQYTYCTVVV